ncbi:hypothetical protein JYT87_01235 [Nitrospira defluvii]|nr:hypothetical protein [Nitrospira defluvii]
MDKVTGRMEDRNQSPELGTIIGYICEQYGVREADLLGRGENRRYSEARGVIGWLAVTTEAANITEMAKHFGRDATTLSRRISGIAANIRESKRFELTIMRHKNAIMQA